VGTIERTTRWTVLSKFIPASSSERANWREWVTGVGLWPPQLYRYLDIKYRSARSAAGGTRGVNHPRLVEEIVF
jgi:hypothetical protein